MYELRPRGFVGKRWVISPGEADCWPLATRRRLLDLVASCTVSQSHFTLAFFFSFMGWPFLHPQLGTTSREGKTIFSLRKKERKSKIRGWMEELRYTVLCKVGITDDDATLG